MVELPCLVVRASVSVDVLAPRAPLCFCCSICSCTCMPWLLITILTSFSYLVISMNSTVAVLLNGFLWMSSFSSLSVLLLRFDNAIRAFMTLSAGMPDAMPKCPAEGGHVGPRIGVSCVHGKRKFPCPGCIPYNMLILDIINNSQKLVGSPIGEMRRAQEVSISSLNTGYTHKSLGSNLILIRT